MPGNRCVTFGENPWALCCMSHVIGGEPPLNFNCLKKDFVTGAGGRGLWDLKVCAPKTVCRHLFFVLHFNFSHFRTIFDGGREIQKKGGGLPQECSNSGLGFTHSPPPRRCTSAVRFACVDDRALPCLCPVVRPAPSAVRKGHLFTPSSQATPSSFASPFGRQAPAPLGPPQPSAPPVGPPQPLGLAADHAPLGPLQGLGPPKNVVAPQPQAIPQPLSLNAPQPNVRPSGLAQNAEPGPTVCHWPWALADRLTATPPPLILTPACGAASTTRPSVLHLHAGLPRERKGEWGGQDGPGS